MQIEEARKLLGLTRYSTVNDVKAAYRDLVRLWHPDRLVNESESLQRKAGEQTVLLNAAYRVALEALQEDLGWASGLEKDNISSGARQDQHRAFIDCHACRRKNPGDFRFCGECGTSLARLCRPCCRSWPASFRFCGSCGSCLV